MHPTNEPENWNLKMDVRNPTVELEIYADEIITPKNFTGVTKNWMGIGCLFVPLARKESILSNLINSRCLFEGNKCWVWDYNSCPFSTTKGGKCKESWHTLNMCEIHHHELKKSRSSNSQKEISKRWINYLIQNGKKDRGDIYFNILYVDLDTLEIKNFGNEKVHENIYNRFFRTVIDYGVKSFFADKKVSIQKVSHDKGSMENHDYFPYLNLKKLDLNLGKNANIVDKEVAFIDSDHRNYSLKNSDLIEASHMIQFVDLILGSITQNIFYLSEDIVKKELAMLIRPLVDSLLKFPNDNNSCYHYYQRQHVSFFPLNYIEDAKYVLTNFSNQESEIYRKNFYTTRKIEMPAYSPQQKNLFMWYDEGK